MKKIDLFEKAEVLNLEQLRKTTGGWSYDYDDGDSHLYDDGDSTKLDNGDSYHSDNGDSQINDDYDGPVGLPKEP